MKSKVRLFADNKTPIRYYDTSKHGKGNLFLPTPLASKRYAHGVTTTRNIHNVYNTGILSDYALYYVMLGKYSHAKDILSKVKNGDKEMIIQRWTKDRIIAYITHATKCKDMTDVYTRVVKEMLVKIASLL